MRTVSDAVRTDGMGRSAAGDIVGDGSDLACLISMICCSEGKAVSGCMAVNDTVASMSSASNSVCSSVVSSRYSPIV